MLREHEVKAGLVNTVLTVSFGSKGSRVLAECVSSGGTVHMKVVGGELLEKQGFVGGNRVNRECGGSKIAILSHREKSRDFGVGENPVGRIQIRDKDTNLGDSHVVSLP